jgi:hypothetical protein
MEAFILFITWLVGLVLGTQMIAACYSVLDLHYRLFYSRYTIVKRIVGWFGGSWIFYLALPAVFQGGFANGILFIVCLFVISRFTPKLMCWNSARKQRQRYEEYLEEIG